MPPHQQAKMNAELLPKFDRMIDELETLLAAEYERIQAAKAKGRKVNGTAR